MGNLDACGKCGNPVLTYGHFVHDETGEAIPEISCFKCGWRAPERIVCGLNEITKVTNEGGVEVEERLIQRKGRAECSNCGRVMALQAKGLCYFCYTRQDNLPLAKWCVENGMIRQGVKTWHTIWANQGGEHDLAR